MLGNHSETSQLPQDQDTNHLVDNDAAQDINGNIPLDINNVSVPPDPVFTRDDVVHLGLLNLCKKLQLPLYAYDEVIKWAQDAHRSGYAFQRSVPSRRNLLDQLYNIFDMKAISPSAHQIPITGNRVVEVVTYSFEEMFRSLLVDPQVWSSDKLVLPSDVQSPILLPNHTDHLGEIVTGDWYAHAFQTMCTQPNDFLCPIILFIDKTHIDEFSRWTLEPVLFTLAVLNRSTRNHAKAWHPLGLVTDTHFRSSA
jgi:hypothetical protein